MPDTKMQDLTTSMPESGAFFPFVSPDGLATYNTTPELLGGAYCGHNSFMTNGVITVSVASNNLTVAIKTIAGTDPSATDPVKIRIGNVYRLITSALSVTKNAGTNWCNAGGVSLATNEVDYFVYLGYNATNGVTIGFSRIPYGGIYSDFSTTSTDEKYCAISTITNAVAGDNYVNIGRFAATLSAGAGYTWTVPTFTAINLIQRPIYNTRILTFTPDITNLTLGAGSKSGYYSLNMYYVRWRGSFTLGAGSSVAGSMYMTNMPFTEPAGYIFQNVVTLNDSGTASYGGSLINYTSGNTKELAAKNTSGTYQTNTILSSTVPFTWTTNDSITISDGEYSLL